MSKSTAKITGFNGLEVVSFESRMAREMAGLISHFGGVPRVAPSMREVPLKNNPAAFAFAQRLLASELDAVIFMTGVGARMLFETLETRYERAKIVRALAQTTVVARGPKAVMVLREFGVPVTIIVPEPNTWREILEELDENPRGISLRGSRVAVQEYGVSNRRFLEELKERGVKVLQVPVYRWALPENLEPLREAIDAIIGERSRVVLFTSAAQVEHVLQVAADSGLKEELKAALRGGVIGSVGPRLSEALLAHRIPADLEPESAKMGPLVHEAAARAAEILKNKSGTRDQKSGRKTKLSSIQVAELLRPKPEAGKVAPWHHSRFLKACRREAVDATPVWLMRQAGRYMKDYRELRARVPFLELCKNPDLVAEVTVTAAEKIRADAAIIFADLLLIAEPLGFGLEYGKGEGPVITPALRHPRDVDRLREVNVLETLGYFFEAIRRTRAALDSRLPLIGFAGAPFTLASYIVEGGASKSFRYTKALMYRDPEAWRALMERLAKSLAAYVNEQIAAGVQAVQIFDTWVGCLGPSDYREYVQPYTRMLMKQITPGTPIVHFGTDTAELLEDMRTAGGDVIGLDWRVELDRAWARLGPDVGVQGNLDPMVLFAGREVMRREAQRILKQAGGRAGHIFNLGHGILPETPFENVVALVEMVHEMSTRQKAKGSQH